MIDKLECQPVVYYDRFMNISELRIHRQEGAREDVLERRSLELFTVTQRDRRKALRDICADPERFERLKAIVGEGALKEFVTPELPA